MSKPADDPFEFDPFADTQVVPEPRPPARETAAAPAPDLFADVEPPPPEPAPAPKPRALQLDFSDVLGREREVQGAQRVGSTSLDTSEFLTKEDRAALERARSAPKAVVPSTIELEERVAGVRVVAENKRVWIWAVVAIIVPVLITLGVVWAYYDQMRRRSDRELEELRRSDEIHRKALEQREQQMLR